MSPSPQVLQALGWTLLHFVWQGAALALLLAVINADLRRSAPQARYLAASAVLLAMVLLPVATFGRARAAGSGPAPLVAPAVVPALAEVATSSTPVLARDSEAAPMRARLEPWLPRLVALWAAGVLLLSLRGVGGWVLVQRLRRTGLREAPAAEPTLARLAAAMRVSAPVRLYESALVHVPTVVGWLRPMILLPASALTGLAPEQLELILAHELAHIRRRDYLVNLVQTAAETLLFYHPAVWWVSHRMRVEREHCCDDLATAAAGSPVRYARALADLEELCVRRREGSPAFVMAAMNGSLRSRIARLLAPPQDVARAPRGVAAIGALAALGLALGVGSSLVATPTSASAVAASIEFVAQPASPQTDASVTEAGNASAVEGEQEKPTPKADRAASDNAGSNKKSTAGTPRASESRAFSLDRILEMARSGITPEYVDEMDALGYASLSADKLIALRSQGVGPDYVRELQKAGYGSLTADQLIALRAQGVSADFAAELKAQGLHDLSLSDLIALRAQGVSPDFVSELKKAGFDDLTVSRLVTLRSQGVSGRFLADMKALGYDKLSLTQIIGLRSQGITREYVQGMADLGYRNLDLPILLGLRTQGVTPEWVRGLKEQGYEGYTPQLLIALRSQGVGPEYVRELKAAGISGLKPEGLIRLRSQGVTPDYIQAMKQLGYGGLGEDALVELRSHGVTPDYVKELKQAGFENLKVEELVELRNQGVRPSLLQRLRGRQ